MSVPLPPANLWLTLREARTAARRGWPDGVPPDAILGAAIGYRPARSRTVLEVRALRVMLSLALRTF